MIAAANPDQADATFLHDLLPFRHTSGFQPGMTTAQGRMSGKRQLGRGGENTHPVIGFRVLRRQQECGFAEVGPVGKGSHARVTEPIGPQHHRQRIALEWHVAEYIQLFVIESAGCRATHSGIFNPRTTAGRARKRSSTRVTLGKFWIPTKSPAS